MSARKDFERLQDEVEELFHDLWRVPRFAGLRRGFRPDIDCYRTDDPPELIVVAELAGVDPESLQIAIDAEGTLVLAGERRRPHGDQRLTYYQLEVEYGRFQRRLRLPEDVDSANARASYEHGVLTIALPIAAKPAPPEKVRITVQKR